MKPTKIEITVYRFDHPVMVELNYTPGEAGHRDGFDRFEEPDEPPLIEILDIFCEEDPYTEIRALKELNEDWLLEYYAEEIQEAYFEKLAENDLR